MVAVPDGASVETRRESRTNTWGHGENPTTRLLTVKSNNVCCLNVEGGRGMPHRARGGRRAAVRERLPSRHVLEGSRQRAAGVSIRQARSKRIAKRGGRACVDALHIHMKQQSRLTRGKPYECLCNAIYIPLARTKTVMMWVHGGKRS